MPPAPGQEEPLKRMTKIVNSLLARQDCSPFREPVDWRGLELYDYPEIITKMMDLGTVKRRLERGYYQTAHQVAEDIRLIWSNCMTYNADGSDFWLLAKSYSRRFEDRYRKVRQECKKVDDVSFCRHGIILKKGLDFLFFLCLFLVSSHYWISFLFSSNLFQLMLEKN